ncbi:MAG TPA: alpha/beta hydrolase [Acidimicrobiia bacterium]
MVPGLFFTYSLVALAMTVNALRRPVLPPSRFPPLWLPGLVTTEMAGFWFVSRIAVAVVAGVAGAWTSTVGRTGFILLGAAQAGLVGVMARNRASRGRLHRSAGTESPPARGWARLFSRHIRRPEHVDLVCEVEYHQGLTLDLYRHTAHRGEPSPTLVYVHGGSWTGGGPHKQARPLFHHLAERGWIVATIRYPLSPAATHPEHLIGVKRALAWCKTTGAAAGVDPDRVAIAGGSAGAHLASLAALTADRSDLQPGFEHLDTSVAACVPMYGVYDFLNRNGTRWDWPVIPQAVMKATAEHAPEAYRDASPIDQIHPGAPPFLVVHGTHDSLVPPLEARHFVDALGAVSRSAVRLLEVDGAQHAFDAFASPRTRVVVAHITRFLEDAVDPLVPRTEHR